MILLGSVGLMLLVIYSVKNEREVLQDPRSILTMLLVLAVVAAAVRWATTAGAADELMFEEAEAPAIQGLGLHRDGVLAISFPQERPPN
jgi:uncharacterized membrane protein YqjE